MVLYIMQCVCIRRFNRVIHTGRERTGLVCASSMVDFGNRKTKITVSKYRQHQLMTLDDKGKLKYNVVVVAVLPVVVLPKRTESAGRC